MLNIAITGGIGSGKSSVTELIRNYGYTVIDADAMSREITSAGGKAIPYILKNFGPEYINEDGSMNRAAMRDLVFKHPGKKRILEQGTTDVVLADIDLIKEEKAKAGEQALFYDIPLLFETHSEDKYDLVWTVYADYEIRKQRVMCRDRIDESIIDLIMGSQTDDIEKNERADYVIYNQGTLEDLESKVKEAMTKYNLSIERNI